jgi:integrase
MFWDKHDDGDGYRMWLSEEETKQLISEAHTDRARLAFQLGVRCGLRSDEIIRVTPTDAVDTEAGWMIRVDSAKTEEKRQTPAPDVVAGMLRAYGSGQDPDEPVIDVTTRTIRNWVSDAATRLQEREGEEMWQYVSPHDLRRTWATNLKGADVESLIVCDWGGWSDLETFLDHYRGAFSPDAQRRQREKVEWL